MTLTAIETRYAGCHFRSRLEARWAVFFDEFGIEWEYEPEGLELRWRLHPHDDMPLRYLPDFWLPQENLYVEVKGDLDEVETIRLLNIAGAISGPDGGGCDPALPNLMVLGPVPRPSSRAWSPTILHMHKGDVRASSWGSHPFSSRGPCMGTDVGRDTGPGFLSEVGLHWTNVRHILLAGRTFQDYEMEPEWRSALAAARSARFEFGESGAT